MDSKHRSVPVGPQRKRCPVCHETVYSRAGIHPQCAVKQAEPPHARPKEKEEVAPPPLAEAAVATVDAAEDAGRRAEG